MDLTILETLKSKLGFVSLGKPALIGMAALLIMVAVYTGRVIIDTATATEIDLGAGIQQSQGSNDGGNQGESSSSDAVQVNDGASASGTPDSKVVVYVSGEVNKPGVVELDQGMRVADAVKKAGGLTREADGESINLAQRVEDGQHISIRGHAEEVSPSETNQMPLPGESANAGDELVNINTADETLLESLPGIGSSTAHKIVADREENGPFTSTEDLKRVSGIGDKKFEALSELICI